MKSIKFIPIIITLIVIFTSCKKENNITNSLTKEQQKEWN